VSTPAGTAQRRQGALVLAAILLYAAIALYGASGKSATFDEQIHVTGGYTYWTLNDYRLHPENGNWAQRWLAIPTVVRGANFLPPGDNAWRSADLWAVSDKFFYDSGNDPGWMLWSGRLMALILACALGFLIFQWSRSLFGVRGGWISLALFVFSPTFLALGPLATSDVMTALLFLASSWALWRAMHERSGRSAVVSMLAVSGLFLSKYSALFFVPMALVMAAAKIIRSPARAREAGAIGGLAIMHVAAVVLVIWASFGFRYSAFGAPSQQGDAFFTPWEHAIDSSVVGKTIAASRATHALPEAYLFGLGTVRAFSKTRATFFQGEVSRDGGRRLFFPYAALVKTTLPALVLVLALPWFIARRRRTDSPDVLYRLTPLFALVGVYWATAIINGLNIGHRHLLPAIAGTTILIGAAGTLLPGRARDMVARIRQVPRVAPGDVGGILLVVLLAWHAIEAARIAPHFLAYVNPIGGGPDRAYRHLVDSSLDWGQDLPALALWLEENATPDTPVYLSYFGTARPSYYGVRAELLPGFIDLQPPRLSPPLRPGVYALSATMLQAVYLAYAAGAWTPDYERQYQAVASEVAAFAAAPDSSRRRLVAARGQPWWIQAFRAYEELRFSRLASHLRRRKPDAHAGYSILIYRVGADELAQGVGGR
jgi:hypothetical protein